MADVFIRIDSKSLTKKGGTLFDAIGRPFDCKEFVKKLLEFYRIRSIALQSRQAHVESALHQEHLGGKVTTKICDVALRRCAEQLLVIAAEVRRVFVAHSVFLA